MADQHVDVVIVGAGPAGLQAAIHAARKKVDVLVLGRIEKSSLYGAHIENYMGVEGVAGGGDLLDVGIGQAKRFGAQFLSEDVLQIEEQGGYFNVKVESGRIIQSMSLIFATGTSRKKLKVPGEKELVGRGVSYCVDCDANFYRNVPVAIVGNESAAVDGALTMLEYASEVYLVGKEFVVSDNMLSKLKESRVETLEGRKVKEILGTDAVTSILLDNGEQITVEGVFIELGAKGAIELATFLGVQLDQETFTHIEINKNCETNVASIWAAGDIAGHPYQMAKAVGEGCVAGMNAASFALKRKREAQKKQ